MGIDEALHRIFDAIQNKEIKFRDFHEVGIDYDYEDWYYAEDGLYVIHDRILDTIKLYKAVSPKDAYEQMVEDAKVFSTFGDWEEDDKEEE